MSRKRKRPGGYRTAAAPVTRASVKPAAPAEAPRMLGWLSRPPSDSPWPSIGRSLGLGFVSVGSSPVVLIPAFVLVLVLWLALVLLGLEGPPGRLVNLLALPPISTYFDALNGVTIYGYGTFGFVAATVFLLVRSVLLALLTALIVREFEGEGTIAEALSRGLRIVPVTIAVNLISLAMMVIGSLVLPALGAGLGFLASVLTLVAALFLFVFAPVIALRDPGATLVDVIRRGARAALMPGSRHLLMCLLYIFLTLPILVALAPGGNLLGVNPSLATWVYALVCTYVHLAFLAAFAYRVMAVEDEIPDTPVRLGRR